LWQQVEEELFLESVDATLLQLREQQRLQAATGGQGRKAAAGRSRSRAEMEGAAAADSSNAPRQVRSVLMACGRCTGALAALPRGVTQPLTVMACCCNCVAAGARAEGACGVLRLPCGGSCCCCRR
jgi:hypothetical protein